MVVLLSPFNGWANHANDWANHPNDWANHAIPWYHGTNTMVPWYWRPQYHHGMVHGIGIMVSWYHGTGASHSPQPSATIMSWSRPATRGDAGGGAVA